MRAAGSRSVPKGRQKVPRTDAESKTHQERLSAADVDERDLVAQPLVQQVAVDDERLARDGLVQDEQMRLRALLEGTQVSLECES